jgi:hypothetical protein
MTDNKKPVRKSVLFVLGTLLIIIAGTAVILLLPAIHPAGPPARVYQNCRLDDSGKLVDPCVPLLRIINGTNNTITYRNIGVWSDSPDNPVPSPEDCQIYAKRGLEPYGGMPEDAVPISVRDRSWWSNGQYSGVGSRMITYRQSPYGMPVFGSAGSMSIEVGGLGNISEIEKRWVSFEEAGLARVIPASEAIRRLERGEGKNILLDALNLTIHDMKLGYYTPVNATVPQYLEPVWVINTTDEIQSRPLTFFVSAEMDPEQHEVYDRNGPGTIRNFSQVKGTVPQPDKTIASNVLIGTSGPVGKERALESVRKFTDNPDISLTYNGRFIEHNECGRVYYWVYYDFTSPGCEFKIETYTGCVLSATMNKACSNAGIRDLTEMMNTTPEQADMLVVNFTRDRYFQFDEHHMAVTYRQSYTLYDPETRFYLEGVSSSIILGFDPDNGLLRDYTVFNSNEVTMCGGEPVRVGD